MAGFLETLDRIQMEQSDLANVFAGEGTSMRQTSNKYKNNPVYRKKLLEATKLIGRLFKGDEPIWKLQEVMTTDDFPLLFGDILDRTMLAKYTEWPASWQGIAKRATVRDFRQAKVRKPLWNANGPLDIVKEGEQYPNGSLNEQDPLLWNVDKFGRQMPFSWEAMINDDLDELKNTPEDFGIAARRTEDWTVANMYVGASGPNTTLYSVGNKNIVNTTNGATVTNPPLTVAGLQDAMTVMNNMVGEDGYPILREFVTLVVPPALEIVAKNILNATEIDITAAFGGGDPGNGTTIGHQGLKAVNWLRNRVNLVVNPYIPMIATSANAKTSWWLFADPNYSREAIRIGFLRGHESPEIFMKSPNAVRVGGGLVDPMSGDFETDSIQYKVRHVLGFLQVDPKATVMSNGTGS